MKRLARRLRRLTAPIPLRLWMVNLVFQRILGINADVPWMVHFTSRVTVPRRILLGRGVRISFAVSGGCYIQGLNGIRIGDDTIFGPNVCIVSADHDPTDLSRHLPCRPIEIGARCWIGAHAVLLPGVVLGDDVIVGAGAVVTRGFPSGSVIAGVPARLIRGKGREDSCDAPHADTGMDG